MTGRIEIINEEDYRWALKRFIELCESEKTNEEIREIMLLSDLMEKYERANCGGS